MSIENDKIWDGIQLLQKDFNKNGILTKYINRLKYCSIEKKKWFHQPYPDTHSTTYGPYCIRLAKKGQHWVSPFLMGRLLLHESCHCFQAERHKPWKTKYVFSYLTGGSFWKQMEKEANDLTKKVMGL